MDDKLETLTRYVAETLGTSLQPISWPGERELPYFLQDAHIFYAGQLLGSACLVMVDRHEDGAMTPAVVRKHLEQVLTRWQGLVIYVRSHMTSYTRKQFVVQHVPFIVPGNQMYLPMLGIDLREHFRVLHAKPETFSPATQAFVLYCLLRDRSGVYTPAGSAAKLGYSAMTMGRAFDELETAHIGISQVTGRERSLTPPDKGKALWERLQPFLRSPVKKRHFVKLGSPLPGCPDAGLSALAHYSMLAEPAVPTVATCTRNWSRLRDHANATILPASEAGAVEVEVWSYDPALFAKDGVVDRLSLYLALRDSQEERLEAALDEMMEAMPW